MTETTTPPAALSVGRLARALHEADAATSPGDHPAWDQLTAKAVERFRTMAGLVIERLGGGVDGGRGERVTDARDRLRGMALSLATGEGPLVTPDAFRAALDEFEAAVLRQHEAPHPAPEPAP